MNLTTLITNDKDVVFISDYRIKEREMYFRVLDILHNFYKHNPALFLPQLPAPSCALEQ